MCCFPSRLMSGQLLYQQRLLFRLYFRFFLCYSNA